MPAAADTSTPTATAAEFDRQLRRLLDLDYPTHASTSATDFRRLVEPLRDRLAELPAPSGDAALPFVIVVRHTLVDTTAALTSVVDGTGERAVVDMEPTGPDAFQPKAGVEIPEPAVYLLADVDLGAEFLNVRPADALVAIEAAGRLPLTIDEGVAVLAAYPDVLDTHHAYQLLASRQAGKRIPSIWRSYGRPRLGWCWDGAPHPWMGSASAAVRLG